MTHILVSIDKMNNLSTCPTTLLVVRQITAWGETQACASKVNFNFIKFVLKLYSNEKRIVIFTARKRSLRRLCFYRCLSFILFTGGACVVLFGGACMVLFRGACVVLFGGCAWFYLGGVRGFIQGGRYAWFYSGGMHGFIRGGMHGFIRGGMRGFFSFFGYNEIRSMSGRYASYWNAFLFSTIVVHGLPKPRRCKKFWQEMYPNYANYNLRNNIYFFSLFQKCALKCHFTRGSSYLRSW